MGWFDRWDFVVLLLVAYVAVMALVRMMARRRDQVSADVQRQLKAHRKRTKNNPGGSKDRGAA